MELLLAVVLTYITITYIFPLLDMVIEVISHKASEVATSIQIKTQTMAKEFEKSYPEYEVKEPAIGFHMSEQLEDYEDDDYIETEDNCDCKNTIGFKMKK